METIRNIGTYNSYEICKKFHLLVPHLSNYLVRVVGIDHDKKKHQKEPKRIRHGKIMHSRMNKRLSHLFHAFLIRKKKKRKSSKKRNHEHAKPV